MIRTILRHPFVAKHGSTFLRFVVCGGFGACIDFGTLHFLVAYRGWEEQYALLVSTGLALLFVFTMNRFFTFRAHGGETGPQLAKFFIVYLTAAGLNYVLTLSLIHVGVHYLLAKAIAIGTMMFFNYALLRGFVFRKKLLPLEDEGLAA